MIVKLQVQNIRQVSKLFKMCVCANENRILIIYSHSEH